MVIHIWTSCILFWKSVEAFSFQQNLQLSLAAYKKSQIRSQLNQAQVFDTFYVILLGLSIWW